MRLFRCLILGCVASLLAGCAGYKLGPSNGQSSGEQSIQVLAFENKTPEPRLSDTLVEQMRKAVQRDGTFRLATGDTPDIVVTGVITNYKRTGETLSRSDLASATNYRLTMTAKITARNRATDKVIMEQSVSGSTLVMVGTDLPSAERQALPLMAANLARNAVAMLADGSW